MPDRLIGKTQRRAEAVGCQAQNFIGNTKQLVLLHSTKGAGVGNIGHWLVWSPRVPTFADGRVLPIHEVGGREAFSRDGHQQAVTALANHLMWKGTRGWR